MKILNYIKISLRTLFLHRGFSLLTLIGLSVGIAMSIFVLEYVFYQFSYDKHYNHSEDIYRVVTEGHLENEKVNAALSPLILASEMKQYSGVEALTRIVDASEKPVQSKYAKSFESEIIYADSSFFSVFSRPVFLGEIESALADSSGVAISRSAASRLFGNRNPIGEYITINEKDSFEVKAVFHDVPQNSHFKYDFVLPFWVIEKQLSEYYGDSYSKLRESWFSLVAYTYFRVKPGIDIQGFSKKMNQDIKTLMDAEDRKLFSGDLHGDLSFNFQALEQIYLFSDNDFEIGTTANPLYVFIFLGVAFFILMVTAFNFMNLTTARALDRVREAGIRRIFGAHRPNLIVQFISESVIFSFAALFLGLVMVELLLPLFNNLFHMDFFDPGYRAQLNLSWILLITLLVGLFSGSYPALVFSGIRAVHLQARQNKFSSNPGFVLRGGLVLVQVFVAVLVATTAIGMWRQLDHISKADLGYDSENLLLLERARYLDDNSDSVINEIAGIKGVEKVSKLYSNPGDPVSVMSFNYSGDSGKIFLLSVHYVDCRVFETLGAKLKTGNVECNDSSRILINEQAALLFGHDGIEGQSLSTINHRIGDEIDFKITGVVEDIYFGSLKQSLRPSIYVPVGRHDTPESILIRTTDERQEAVIDDIRLLWNDAGTGAPFVVSTIEEKINSFYQEDYRYSSLATAFAILIIIISSLGMTGLVSFLLATRQQNALLRKITGIPDFHNLSHLFSGYLMFVLLGAVISFPVSHNLLKAWAGTFSFHYEMDYFCFVVPALLLLLIASVIAWYGGKRLLGKMSIHQF